MFNVICYIAEKIPLTRDSCHPPSVHGWSRAMLARLRDNSSFRHDFEQAKLDLIGEFWRNFLDPDLVSDMMSADPWGQSRVVQPHPDPTVTTINLILRWHPCFLGTKLLSLVKPVLSRHAFICKHLLGTSVELRLAWSNSGPPLHISLRNRGRRWGW